MNGAFGERDAAGFKVLCCYSSPEWRKLQRHLHSWPSCHRVGQFSSVQSPSHVRIFVTPWTAARQASLSITNSQRLLKLMFIELVMPSNHLILSSVVPFSSYLQSFPVSGSFPVSQFFASGGQSIEVSALASVLPMNIQDWFPLDGLVWSPCGPDQTHKVISAW